MTVYSPLSVSVDRNLYESIHYGNLNVHQYSSWESKFLSRVSISDDDNCWMWTGSTLGPKHMYGRLGSWLSHRLSYALYIRSPEEFCVLHNCDVPLCVNPHHLFLGTQQDNLEDMRVKDRQVRGVDQGSAVLSENDVKEIRRRYKRYSRIDGSVALAEKFGVSPVQIWRISKNLQWRHVE